MPHSNAEVLAAGVPPDRARAAVVLVHGRGGSAVEMLGFSEVLGGDDIAFLAPQASGNSWYPLGFMEPMELNQPGLNSGLAVVEAALDHLAGAGLAARRVMLLGFSQGACLALEFAARNARRYGALGGWSGGLIGPIGTPRDYPGSLDGTPVFLACSDVDPHIPLARVEETTSVLERLGGSVDRRIYPGMGHLVNEDEIGAASALLDAIGSDTGAEPEA